MKRLLALVVLVGCPAQTTPPPVAPVQAPPPVVVTPPPQVVVPTDEAPKLRLPRTFAPTSYAAHLIIDPTKPTFDGRIAITGEIATAANVFWLHARHLTIKKAEITGSSGLAIAVHTAPRGEDQLELTTDAALPPGTYKLAIEYAGEVDTINTTGMFAETYEKAPYVYSQFEAIYARRVFPCLDEPDSKVPWQLRLEVPKGQIAVSNTPVASESDEGSHHVFEFAPTKPLPAYLVAFGVGPFDFVAAGKTKSGIPVRIIVPKGHSSEASFAAKTTVQALDLLEAWFQIPYPYAKLDILTVPITAGFGAMENAGLISCDANYVLLEAKPSWDRRITDGSGLAHELAHQWFGDLVTTAWWDDIWLNEGFANWMEHKISAQIDPAWHYDLHELSMRDDALGADAVAHARQIRQPIAVQGDILNAFDGITYNKGASILNMFESYVGAETFQRGVRAYLKERAFGNATSSDFIAAISKASGKDLAPALATFLDQPGEPEITATLTCGKQPSVELAQQRYLPVGADKAAATKPWIIPVCIAYEQDGKRAETCTLLDAPTGTLALQTKSCPRWVMPNVNGRGYYRVHYTAKQATALRDEAWPALTGVERRAIFGDVTTFAANPAVGKLPVVLALSFIPKLLQATDQYSIGEATGLVGALSQFVAPDQRAKLEAWSRGTFGPGATKLGLVPKDSDDVVAEDSRGELVKAGVIIGRDPELIKQAQALAGHWRDLPESARLHVVRIAIEGDAERTAQAIAEVRSSKKRDERHVLIAALAEQLDPKNYAAALELTLDPTLDLRETSRILYDTRTETRPIAEAFYRKHAEEIEARLPKDEVAGGLYSLVSIFVRACDAKQRDEIVREVTTRFASRDGGARVVAQSIESMDQCIAIRAVLEPEIRGWLGGVKIPRPPVPEKKTEKKKAKAH